MYYVLGLFIIMRTSQLGIHIYVYVTMWGFVCDWKQSNQDPLTATIDENFNECFQSAGYTHVCICDYVGFCLWLKAEQSRPTNSNNWWELLWVQFDLSNALLHCTSVLYILYDCTHFLKLGFTLWCWHQWHVSIDFPTFLTSGIEIWLAKRNHFLWHSLL